MAIKRKRLNQAQIAALKAAAAKDSSVERTVVAYYRGRGGQMARGAAGATLLGLVKRGWLTRDERDMAGAYTITEAGREALAEALGCGDYVPGREFRRGVPPFYSNLPSGTPRLSVVCPGTATEHNANDCRNRVFAICAGCILGKETL